MKSLYQAKKQKIATAFFEEIEEYKIESDGSFPKYSSKYKFYKDVFVNLLICQKGLCAYSEMAIDFDYNNYESQNLWNNGRFAGNKPIIDADIEHFHPKSKCELKCDWDWNNLFLVSKHINQSIKRDKPVYDFMRPDNPEYDPVKYLTYDFRSQLFIPNPELDEQTYAQVDETINTLGINTSSTVNSRRKNMLYEFLLEIYYKKYTYDEIMNTKLKEFHTAYEMSKFIFTNQNIAKKFIKIKINN